MATSLLSRSASLFAWSSPTLPQVAVASLLICVVSLCIFLYIYRAKSLPGLPGPEAKPFVGIWPHLDKNIDAILDWQHANSLKYKRPWGGGVPFESPWVFVVSPQDVEHVLKTKFDIYEKGESFRDPFMELLGDGIFNTDGEMWRLLRKNASHMFSMKIMKTDMLRVFLEHGHTFLSLLDQATAAKSAVDMQDLFFRYTMDSMGEIAFGVKLGSLEHGKASVPFAQAFDDAQNIVTRRKVTPTPIWKLKRLLRTPSERKMSHSIKVINEFAAGIIAQRRQVQSSVLREYPDLLSQFISTDGQGDTVTTPDDEKIPLTDKFLRDLIINFMIAGRDTTACMLSWFFYELSQNPAVAAKVVAEIQDKLKGQLPSYESAKTLMYMEAALLETLRLHPSVPIDLKYPRKDDQLPSGVIVPAGCTVGYSPYAMGRDPTLWKDPLRFDPSRFLITASDPNADAGLSIYNPSAFEYPVFNAGPRTCLGKHVAIMEGKICASMILARYHMTLVPGTDVRYYSPNLILSMRNPLSMVPQQR